MEGIAEGWRAVKRVDVLYIFWPRKEFSRRFVYNFFGVGMNRVFFCFLISNARKEPFDDLGPSTFANPQVTFFLTTFVC